MFPFAEILVVVPAPDEVIPTPEFAEILVVVPVPDEVIPTPE